MNQLMAIERANPGIKLSTDDQKRATQGILLQVGVGAIIPTGPIFTANPRPSRPDFIRGCVEYLRFQKSSEDLTMIIVDGDSYSGDNINEFREVLLEASLAMKCVSFCWDTEKREMTMLNVLPKCCCECERTG